MAVGAQRRYSCMLVVMAALLGARCESAYDKRRNSLA